MTYARQQAYRKKQRILCQSLERLQQKRCEYCGRLDHLAHFRCSARLSELLEFALCDLLAPLLVGNVRLVDLESILVQYKEVSPILLGGGLSVCLLDTDEEAALEIEESVEVEEDVVDLVSANDALLFDELLEFLQKLEMLHVGALGLDQLFNDVFSLGALAQDGRVVEVGGGRVDLAHLDERVEDFVDDVGDLQE